MPEDILSLPWRVHVPIEEPTFGEQNLIVMTDEEHPWVVCTLATTYPSPDDARRLAAEIVALHNAALKTKQLLT